MSKYLIQSETLTAIANKIRAATGSSGPLSLASMITALDNVEGGLSGSKDRIVGYQDNLNSVEQIFELKPPRIETSIDLGNISNYFSSVTAISLPLLEGIGSGNLVVSGIESVDLPSCTEVDSATFQSCSSLSSLNIPSCTEIGSSAFEGCASLSSLYLPMCETVGSYAFSDCESLVNANLSSCTEIGENGFSNCTALENIYLNTVCVLNDYVFNSVLDPDNKTFRIYFTGTTMAQNYGNNNGRFLFSSDDIFNSGGSVSVSESDSGVEQEAETTNSQPIPGLEIYVPANLLTDFQTSWCGGLYANNIYAEQTETESE